MRPVLWGLILSIIGFVLWIFFGFLFAIAKIIGTGTTAYVFLLTTFGLLGFFSLPIGAVLDLSRKRPKIKYLAYALIAFAIICWVGAFSTGIKEEEASKPIRIRDVNIVKEGEYADNVFFSCFPPLTAQYGEFKLDIRVTYFKPIMGPESITVQSIQVLTSGFELKHIEPPLPFSIGSSSITFTLTLKGPQEGFDGPITLKITLSG